MSYLRKAVENKRQYYIDKLINVGIYKVHGLQLYKLTLSELEKEFLYYTR